MNSILERFSFDEINIIRICKNDKKYAIIDELKIMQLYSDPEVKNIIEGLVTKIRELPEEEIKKAAEFPV